MPVTCHPSNVCNDVRCAVCGQGFLIYDEQYAAQDRGVVRRAAQERLRHHSHSCQHEAFDLKTVEVPVAKAAPREAKIRLTR